MLLPWHWLRTGVPGWDRSTQDQGAEFLSHLCTVLGGAEKLEEQYYAWLWWLCLSSVCFLNVLMLLRAMRAQSLHYSGARANASLRRGHLGEHVVARDQSCRGHGAAEARPVGSGAGTDGVAGCRGVEGSAACLDIW